MSALDIWFRSVRGSYRQKGLAIRNYEQPVIQLYFLVGYETMAGEIEIIELSIDLITSVEVVR